MMRASLLTAILLSIAGADTKAMERSMANCEVAASEGEAARRAFFSVFPLYEMWRTRQQMLSRPGARINGLIHRRTLSQPADRSITMPNTDTLYSTAWLDLADGPVRLTMPAMASRYHSVQLMHAFSDVFAILRNEGSSARHFLIVGPHWNGIADPDETIVRSPTRDAWLVARTHVKGADDLAEAQRLQGEYMLAGRDRAIGAIDEAIPARPNGSQFLAVVNTVLARGPLPQVQAARIGCLAGADELRGNTDAMPRIDPALRAVFDRDLDGLYKATGQAFENIGKLRRGWQYPLPYIANFGSDDVYRSAMALGGLAALPASEAMNPLTIQDADGALLAGSSRYRLRIPGHVPVDAFWSLTLYESDGAGRWFLYRNPIGRHGVNSIANDFVPQADGSFVLDVSHTQPIGRANWLPAPHGRFLLLFRAYRPGAAFIDGTFYLPAVERVDDE